MFRWRVPSFLLFHQMQDFFQNLNIVGVPEIHVILAAILRKCPLRQFPFERSFEIIHIIQSV